MRLKIVLEEQPEGGYTVTVPSMPGCISEGDSRREALANIKEAIKLWLTATPQPTSRKGRRVLEIAV